MSTGYTLEIGYNSVFGRDEIWPKMRAAVLDLMAHPEKIAAEVLRLEPDRNPERLKDFTTMYEPPIEDLTLKIIEDESGSRIYQSASGGGDSRDYKEACRRAVCRLVIEAMHRERMEVSLVVS